MISKNLLEQTHYMFQCPLDPLQYFRDNRILLLSHHPNNILYFVYLLQLKIDDSWGARYYHIPVCLSLLLQLMAALHWPVLSHQNEQSKSLNKQQRLQPPSKQLSQLRYFQLQPQQNRLQLKLLQSLL